MSASKIHITSFYLFFTWPSDIDFKQKSDEIESWCTANQIYGLLLIGNEGFNGTLAAFSPSSFDMLKKYVRSLCSVGSVMDLQFKDSTSDFMPFRRTKVKFKKEIVTLGKVDVKPLSGRNESRLSPEEWNLFIKSKNPTVLDVRNTYEMEIGKFKTALNCDMNEFTEFPDLVRQMGLDKKEPVLMYCTGGIRCEKASVEMLNQGFENVYQLDGGILNYIEQFPEDEFQGECFVFDHRVALDQSLKPTLKFVLCHHCGQPAKISFFKCAQCGIDTVVCETCLEKNVRDLSIRTCSKNCRHHYKMGHKTTRLHVDSKSKFKNTIAPSRSNGDTRQRTNQKRRKWVL